MNDRQAPNRSKLFALAMLAPLVLFLLFFLCNVALNGDAFYGKIVSDHYFVGNHGVFTEVSREEFLFSLWLGRTMVASFVAMAAFSLSLGAWRALASAGRRLGISRK